MIVYKQTNARDYVPEILANVYQTQLYFFSGYIEGEAWLEKRGCLDLTIGLQGAHEKGICHLDC